MGISTLSNGEISELYLFNCCNVVFVKKKNSVELGRRNIEGYVEETKTKRFIKYSYRTEKT